MVDQGWSVMRVQILFRPAVEFSWGNFILQNQDRISAAIKTATTRLLCAARSACGIGAVALAGFAGSVAPAWSQSCIDQMDATETEVLALIAESEGSDSIRVQCEYLVKALDVQLAFLTKCPEPRVSAPDPRRGGKLRGDVLMRLPGAFAAALLCLGPAPAVALDAGSDQRRSGLSVPAGRGHGCSATAPDAGPAMTAQVGKSGAGRSLPGKSGGAP